VDLVHGLLHVARVKNGMPSVHPLTGKELRALRRLQREQEPGRYARPNHRSLYRVGRRSVPGLLAVIMSVNRT
jgi:hypothetical protein